MPYVCVLEIELHFPENSSLKGKRRELSSLRGVPWPSGNARFGRPAAYCG